MKYKMLGLYMLGLCVKSMFAANIQGIYEEEANRENVNTDSKVAHVFKEDIYREYNPLFTSTFKKTGLSYAGTLGLSDSQTLVYNGLATQYRHPFVLKKTQLDVFAKMALGNALLTTQTIQNHAFFFGANLGANASIPLFMQDEVAHGVFGVDIGFGMLSGQVSDMMLQGFFGIDFFYDKYVFRPFISLSLVTPFSSVYNVSIAGLTDIGLKTFYRGDYLLGFISVAVSNLFSKNNAKIFALLPQSTPLFLGGNSLKFDVNVHADYFVTQYLSFSAMALVTYTLSYHALSTGGQVGVNYRF
ncbi:MAG: hypothetical protein MR025_01435 [Helicobacter trogontum]|uniref:hypothetical protein n=1 Tax=Helicobacter trogontum TaxID=50960 RepID=UPI002431978D|nr:hypothetical protein [Helicobacter trogontum]MCI5786105.1 hypothetical protein [Helicobacter trogontum]